MCGMVFICFSVFLLDPPMGGKKKAFDILLMRRARGLEKEKEKKKKKSNCSVWDCPGVSCRCWQAFLFWFFVGGVGEFACSGELKRKRQTCWGEGPREGSWWFLDPGGGTAELTAILLRVHLENNNAAESSDNKRRQTEWANMLKTDRSAQTTREKQICRGVGDKGMMRAAWNLPSPSSIC